VEDPVGGEGWFVSGEEGGQKPEDGRVGGGSGEEEPGGESACVVDDGGLGAGEQAE